MKHPQSIILERHIQAEDICSETAQALIQALNSELIIQYPEVGAAQHFRLEPDEVAHGQGAFLVAYVNGHAQGCGAVRKLNATQAELKRMYIKPEARGMGLGAMILAALEAQALSLGVQELLLETGPRQRAAITMYQQAGFTIREAFGEYQADPLSIFMAKGISNP